MAQEKSVRGNMVPAGGATATAESTQAQALLPDTFTLQRMSEIFMAASEQNCIKLNTVNLPTGQQTGFIINNVGLGESLDLLITGSIELDATTENGANIAIDVSPDFPFNILSQINVQFNGQTVLASLSGYELLGVMAKRYKDVFKNTGASAGNIFNQNLARVDRTIAWITADDEYAALTTGNTLTGISKITVTKGKKTGVKFGMYLELPFVLRRDLLFGLIPMQNNSVYATVQMTVPNIIGTTPLTPLSIAAIPATLKVTPEINCQPTYNFWSIPVPNDRRLYQYLVSHSYMLLSQGNNVLSQSGIESMQYTMPNNYYLLGLLLTIRDSNKALVDCYSKLDNPYLSYNGTVRVDRRDMATRTARQIVNGEGIVSPLGQILWDATDVTYLPNGTNTTKWLNMYQANNPQFIADVAATVGVPGSYAVLREQLVPANVTVI